MLCPRCNSINKDTDRQCRECGLRLTGVRVTESAKKAESKYLFSGIIAFVGIVLVVTLLVTTVCCIGCKNGCISCSNDENYINENVDGDWDVIDASGSDVVSYSDGYVDDVPADSTAQPAVD